MNQLSIDFRTYDIIVAKFVHSVARQSFWEWRRLPSFVITYRGLSYFESDV